jgi:hypothetical protein
VIRTSDYHFRFGDDRVAIAIYHLKRITWLKYLAPPGVTIFRWACLIAIGLIHYQFKY